ncbi:MAG: hypothetical protein HYT41_00885 [Candidatus Sungbacteria bacterium]|nr:hypothetical protein [Candidatus Sungbacteria bacterium]
MQRALKVLSVAILGLMFLLVSVHAQTTVVGKDGTATTSGQPAAHGSLASETGGGGGGSGVCGEGAGTSINVDGCPQDWFALGARPIITDEYGDYLAGADILNVWVTDDGQSAYFLAEFAAPPTATFYFFLDTNSTPKTGCQIQGIGVEYGITIDPKWSFQPFLGDARDCGWGADDYPGVLKVAMSDRFVEFSLPLDILRQLTQGTLTKFSVVGMNDGTPVGKYFLRGVGANVHGFLPVEGFCANFTTGQFITVPAGRNEWNCPDLGFKVRPGDQVFTGAAGVVLAPPRPKK